MQTGRKVYKDVENIKYNFIAYIPENLNKEEKAHIVVWGHGSSSKYESYQDLSESPDITSNLEMLEACAKRFEIIILMPVLPRISEPGLHADTQMLCAETMVSSINFKDEFYIRADLEILKMIEFLKKVLDENDIKYFDKVILGGISAGAGLANRFSVLHPDITHAVLMISSGNFMYPEAKLKDIDLIYPFGISNIDEIDNVSFSKDTLKSIFHYVFIGIKDLNPNNDPLGHDLSYNYGLFEKYKENLGGNQVIRTRNYVKYLVDNDYNVVFVQDNTRGHGTSMLHVMQALKYAVNA